MIRVRGCLFAAILIGLCAVQTQAQVIRIDGKLDDWGRSVIKDGYKDVEIPSIDIMFYKLSLGDFYTSAAERDSLQDLSKGRVPPDINESTQLRLLFRFLEKVFAGSAETTIEFFLDVDEDDLLGDPHEKWPRLKPEVVMGVRGRMGEITSEFRRDWDGTSWILTEEKDLPGIVAAADSVFFEVLISLSAVGSSSGEHIKWGAIASQGDARDYLPDDREMDLSTAITNRTWGEVKRDQK